MTTMFDGHAFLVSSQISGGGYCSVIAVGWDELYVAVRACLFDGSENDQPEDVTETLESLENLEDWNDDLFSWCRSYEDGMIDVQRIEGFANNRFGSLLSELIRMAHFRVDARTNPEIRGYYVECRFCGGSDFGKRDAHERPQILLVGHKPDCSLGHYLPALRALANFEVT
jgi:hypothetical protein